MIQIPDSAEELIQLLDKANPEQCPNPSQTEREIWMQAGRRQLVRELLSSQARDERVRKKSTKGPQRVP